MLALFLKTITMTARIIPFPTKRTACIWITREVTGAWVVLAPRGNAWIHGSRPDAMADAIWLSENFGGLPIRSAA